MRGFGSKIMQMASEGLFLIMAIIILASGNIISLMVSALIILLMDANILAHGEIVYKMVLAWRRGPMEISMKENLILGRDIILELLVLLTEISLLGNFKMMNCTVEVYSVGIRKSDMMASGKIIKCMVKDLFNGLMVANFQAIFTKI